MSRLKKMMTMMMKMTIPALASMSIVKMCLDARRFAAFAAYVEFVVGDVVAAFEGCVIVAVAELSGFECH